MNDEYDGTLVFRFGVDDEGLDAAAIVFDGDPLAVTRGFYDAFAGPGLRPFLRGGGLRANGDGDDGEYYYCYETFHGAPR